MPKKKRAKQKTAKVVKHRRKATAIKRILAVAIGELAKQQIIKSDPAPSSIRPYIQGLINGLSEKNYAIGAQYIIDYRECRASQLKALFQHSSPKAVFCMSTRVVGVAAKRFSDIPIIGVVSDYSQYSANKNVCGYSAKRFQTTPDGYDNFLKTIPALSAVYVLSEKNYLPSDNALGEIRKRHPQGTKFSPIEVDVTEGRDIPKELDKQKFPSNAGLFVLPIDRCFGAADIILNWARDKMPTFWPVPDWVKCTKYPCAVGGYGVSQELCGYHMAEKLAYIWSNNGALPAKRFDDCNQTLIAAGGDLSWVASRHAADRLGATLGSPSGLNII